MTAGVQPTTTIAAAKNITLSTALTAQAVKISSSVPSSSAGDAGVAAAATGTFATAIIFTGGGATALMVAILVVAALLVAGTTYYTVNDNINQRRVMQEVYNNVNAVYPHPNPETTTDMIQFTLHVLDIFDHHNKNIEEGFDGGDDDFAIPFISGKTQDYDKRSIATKKLLEETFATVFNKLTNFG